MRKKIVAPRSSLIFPLAELLVELAEDGFPPIDEERDDDEDDGFLLTGLLLVELVEDGFPPIDEERDDDEDDGFLLLVDIGIVATSARGT